MSSAEYERQIFFFFFFFFFLSRSFFLLFLFTGESYALSLGMDINVCTVFRQRVVIFAQMMVVIDRFVLHCFVLFCVGGDHISSPVVKDLHREENPLFD